MWKWSHNFLGYKEISHVKGVEGSICWQFEQATKFKTFLDLSDGVDIKGHSRAVLQQILLPKVDSPPIHWCTTSVMNPQGNRRWRRKKIFILEKAADNTKSKDLGLLFQHVSEISFLSQTYSLVYPCSGGRLLLCYWQVNNNAILTP